MAVGRVKKMKRDEHGLPWRTDGLDGYSTSQGPTYNGGWFVGGGGHRPQSMTIRVLTPMGRTATVEVDLCDEAHGRSVTLSPDLARSAAAALVAAADKADREMEHWRGVVERQRAELAELAHRDALRRAGLPQTDEAV